MIHFRVKLHPVEARVDFWMAQTGALAVSATTSNPRHAGDMVTVAHPDRTLPLDEKAVEKRSRVPCAHRSACPNSRLPGGTTSPPKWRLISCMP